MYVSIENYFLLIACTCAIYTTTLYLFYLINYFILFDGLEQDPLLTVIKRGACVTICLYMLAGLAYLAG